MSHLVDAANLLTLTGIVASILGYIPLILVALMLAAAHAARLIA